MSRSRKAPAPRRRPGAPVIGIALGSGSARGWSHIGVLQGLIELGIEPRVVCGTSIGALVGAAYVRGNLDALARWATGLRRSHFLRFLDIRMPGSGLVHGERLMEYLRRFLDDEPIEDLPKAFGTVATDLVTGREVWFRDGPLHDAVRASIAIPGLFTPMRQDERWLVDGGLVNPVPVTLCRALGAHLVIGVNPYGDRTARFNESVNGGELSELGSELAESLASERRGLRRQALQGLFQRRGRDDRGPSMLDVLVGALNVMQDRITRSRMAGDPPDVLLTPRLSHVTLLEFDRAGEAIAEGRACVERMLPALQDAVGL